MMRKLFLLRHGETDLNTGRKIQGISDSPLNARGKRQSYAAAVELKKCGIQAIYSSTLKRAEQTADIIAGELGLTVFPSPILREVNFGSWEGLTLEELMRKDGNRYSQWQKSSDTKPPGGESMYEAMTRTSAFVKQVKQEAGEKNTLIVGHGAIFQAMLCSLMAFEPSWWWPFHLYTSSISELWLFEKGSTLISLNRLDHLEKAGLDPESVKGR